MLRLLLFVLNFPQGAVPTLPPFQDVPGEAHFEHLRPDSQLWLAAVDSLMTYL